VKAGRMFKKYLALLLLLIFALAITPMQLLHDAIATHQHHLIPATPDARINKASFLCDCDNMVAEGSFVDLNNQTEIAPQFEYSVFSLQPHDHYEQRMLSIFNYTGHPFCEKVVTKTSSKDLPLFYECNPIYY